MFRRIVGRWLGELRRLGRKFGVIFMRIWDGIIVSRLREGGFKRV